ASVIRTYESHVVPGLLQTRDYARAVNRALMQRATPAEVERHADLRLARQERALQRAPAPTLWAVIDGAALRRPIGGMNGRRQPLLSLVEGTSEPNIKAQIRLSDRGAHTAVAGAFAMLGLPEHDQCDGNYLEVVTSALYRVGGDDVESYAGAMERLCLEARQP